MDPNSEFPGSRHIWIEHPGPWRVSVGEVGLGKELC